MLKSSDDVVEKVEVEFLPKSLIYAPYPQRLEKPQMEDRNQEIMDTFKQVKINIPLLDGIKQVPSYIKFLKDLCIVKMRISVKKKAFLANQVSSII